METQTQLGRHNKLNLFRRRILLYSPSRRMTIYMLLSSCRVANVGDKIKELKKFKI